MIISLTSPGRSPLQALLLAAGILVAGLAGCTEKNGAASPPPAPGKVVGTVDLDSHVPLWMTHGSLSVVALMKGPTSPDWLPVARVLFIHPTFPVPFEISQKDVRLTGITFQGPVRLVARLSLESGSSLVTSGEYSGSAPVAGAVGGVPVRIVIDKKLPSMVGSP